MVIPRSFSRSLESMARSSTRWLSRNVPDWRKSWSTSVVLPWSTWAMIAILRKGRDMKGFLRKPGYGLAAAVWGKSRLPGSGRTWARAYSLLCVATRAAGKRPVPGDVALRPQCRQITAGSGGNARERSGLQFMAEYIRAS
jgi:hypothetical protein